jgi:calcineurin-like phosphoesterase family protein
VPDTWFTADFHLGHANIIRYCNRPFAIVEEMDQAILERLNGSVKVNDTLYFLGDFCMGSQTRVIAYRRRIRGFSPCPEITTRSLESSKTSFPGSTIWQKF